MVNSRLHAKRQVKRYAIKVMKFFMDDMICINDLI